MLLRRLATPLRAAARLFPRRLLASDAERFEGRGPTATEEVNEALGLPRGDGASFVLGGATPASWTALDADVAVHVSQDEALPRDWACATRFTLESPPRLLSAAEDDALPSELADEALFAADPASLTFVLAATHAPEPTFDRLESLFPGSRTMCVVARRVSASGAAAALAGAAFADLSSQSRKMLAATLADLAPFDFRYGEAMAQYERALGIRERQLGPEHPDVATLVNNMAALLAAQKKLAEAKPLYERAMDIYAKRLGSEHPLFATALTNLATMYRQMNDFQAAVPLYRLALRLRAKHYGEVHLEVAAATTVLAAVLRNLHRFDEAKALYKKALKTREECAGKISRPVATSFNNLGHCHKCAGEFEEGVVAYKRALRIREKVQGNDSVPYAKSLVGLGTCYMELRKWTDAVDSYAQAVAIIERSDGPDSTDLVRPLKDLAIALSKLGRNKEARENRRKSVAVHRAIAREGGGNSMMETSLRATSKTCVIS